MQGGGCERPCADLDFKVIGTRSIFLIKIIFLYSNDYRFSEF